MAGAPAEPSRKRVGLIVAAIGAIAVLSVGALAVDALVGGSGGASSPQAAVQRLADAVAAEDPVAVAAALAPDEVGSLGALLAEVEETAQESGFAPDEGTFAGIDITAEDLEYEVDELGDGVARVEVIGGEIGFSFEPDELTPEARELLGDDAEPASEQADIAEMADEAGEKPYLVTIRRDDGWYVSVAYTVAEYIVDDTGLPDADFDDEVAAGDPAEDPEGAVVALVEALARGDVDALATHLPEDEAAVLAPYREAIDEMLGDGGFEIGDVEVEVQEELDDGARRVRILGAEGTIESEGEEIAWELDGLCVRFEGFDDGYSDQFVDAFTDELCTLIEDSYLAQVLQPEGPSVVVVPERGGWVVSPVETVLLAVRDILPRLDHDTIVTLAGRPDLVPPEGEAPLGEVFDVDLGDAGVATRTVTAERDVELIVASGDDEAEVFLVGPDGEDVETGDDGYLIEEGVRYVLVVQRIVRAGDTPVEVALGAVAEDDLGEVALAGTIVGTLSTAGPVRRTSFTLDREVTAQIVVDGDVIVDVLEDGEYICSEGDACTFEPGPGYVIAVQPRDGLLLAEEVDYEIAFEVVPEEAPGSGAEPDTPDDPGGPGDATEASIDGDTSVTGFLDGGGDTAYHEIVVPDGVSVVVTIVADEPTEDIDAYLDTDSFEELGDEEFVLDGPIADEMEVYLFSDGATGYTITLEPA